MENRSDFTPNTVKLPDGIESFKFQLDNDKKRKYLLDIIPYVAKEGNPVADEGQLHWERTYYVHKGIGPQEKWYICATSTFGEDHPCPVCEHAAKLRRQGKGDKETLKEFRPSKRQLFYVKDRLEKGGKVRVLDTYGYMKTDTAFGQLIDAKLEAKMDKPNHPYHNFFHLEDGMAIEVLSQKQTYDKGSFVTNAGSIDFVKRKEQYEEEEFADLPSLDDLLIHPDYDKMKKAFLEGGASDEDDEEEDDEDEKPKNKKKKKEEDDDQEDSEDEDEGDEDESEDEDEDDSDDDGDEDESEDEEEDEEGDEDSEEEDEDDDEEVKKKPKKKPKKKKKDDDEDEEPFEEEDDEDEDEDGDDSDDEDEEEEEEEEDDEEPRKKKTKKPVKKGKKKKEEEEEEDDEDDDDAPWNADDDDEDEDSEDEDEEEEDDE